ncbi:hypothetical protein B0J14DRAFT_671107 [Halenospora varia]|nr:hypothetical protein B0J14DRAFT_671107 [Halenospora varia]
MAQPQNTNAPSFTEEQRQWLQALLANSHPELLQQISVPDAGPPPYSESSSSLDTTTSRIPQNGNSRSGAYDFPETNPFRQRPTGVDCGPQENGNGFHRTNRQFPEEKRTSLPEMSLPIRNAMMNSSNGYEMCLGESSYTPPQHQSYQAFQQQIQAQYPQQEAYPPPSQISQNLTPTTTTQEDAELLSKTLLFTKSLPPPPPTRAHPLQKPILIPQISPNGSWLRSYALSLDEYNLPLSSFLAFLDNLNIVAAASPPLQVLNMAGGILGMVPHHWAQLAGAGLQAGSQVGTKVVSKTRMGRFMGSVQERMFEGRGLVVRIGKWEDVERSLGRELVIDEMKVGAGSAMEKALRIVEAAGGELLQKEGLPPRSGGQEMGVMDKWSRWQVQKEREKSEKKAVEKAEKDAKKEKRKVKREESRERKRERKERKRERSRERKEKRRDKRDKKDKGKGKERSEDSDSESVDSEDSGSNRGRQDGLALETSRVEDDKAKMSGDKSDRKSREKSDKEIKKLLWVVIENM